MFCFNSVEKIAVKCNKSDVGSKHVTRYKPKNY